MTWIKKQCPHWPTVIDQIIDLIRNIEDVRIGQWYKPDYDHEMVALVLYDCRVSGTRIDELIKQLPGPVLYEWDVSIAYKWVDTKGEYGPIYRDYFSFPPKNKRWRSDRCIQLHLFFKVDVVGVPELWTNNMRSINAGRSQKDQ